MANPDPVLQQSVRYGEQYTSRALNQKFAGVIKPGIYRGFKLVPGDDSSVQVVNGADGKSGVAVFERDDYSLTVIMTDGGYVDIPAYGDWFICLECCYALSPAQSYQRIVARESVEPYHVVLGKVLFDDTGVYIRDEDRMDAEILTHMEVEEIKDKFKDEVQIALDKADEALVTAIDIMDCKVEEVIDIINDKLADALDDAHAVNAETRELLESAANINGVKNDIVLSTGIIRNATRLTRLELLHAGYDWGDLPPVEIIPPENPDNPDNPNPDNPDNPNPDNPDVPENPDTPENPNNPGNCNCNCCGNSNRLYLEVRKIQVED